MTQRCSFCPPELLFDCIYLPSCGHQFCLAYCAKYERHILQNRPVGKYDYEGCRARLTFLQIIPRNQRVRQLKIGFKSINDRRLHIFHNGEYEFLKELKKQSFSKDIDFRTKREHFAEQIRREERSKMKAEILARRDLEEQVYYTKLHWFRAARYLNILICKENEPELFQLIYDSKYKVLGIGVKVRDDEVIQSQSEVSRFSTTLADMGKDTVVVLYGKTGAGKTITTNSIIQTFTDKFLAQRKLLSMSVIECYVKDKDSSFYQPLCPGNKAKALPCFDKASQEPVESQEKLAIFTVRSSVKEAHSFRLGQLEIQPGHVIIRLAVDQRQLLIFELPGRGPKFQEYDLQAESNAIHSNIDRLRDYLRHQRTGRRWKGIVTSQPMTRVFQNTVKGLRQPTIIILVAQISLATENKDQPTQTIIYLSDDLRRGKARERNERLSRSVPISKRKSFG